MIPTELSVRQGFATPAPIYVAPAPEPTLLDRRAWAMQPHEKLRIRTAAFRATRIYPGPVGKMISRELLAYEELGLRLARDGVVMEVVDHIMKAPLDTPVRSIA